MNKKQDGCPLGAHFFVGLETVRGSWKIAKDKKTE